MLIKSFFTYCPLCKSAALRFSENKRYTCADCGWEYYHNAAAAAGAVLVHGEKLLLIVRKREPARGRLDMPGGFVDPGESAEEACRREVREELGIGLESLTYFKSFANVYAFKGVTYSTCDIFFLASIDVMPDKLCKEEVEDVVLMKPVDIDVTMLAFPSTKLLIAALKEEKSLQALL